MSNKKLFNKISNSHVKEDEYEIDDFGNEAEKEELTKKFDLKNKSKLRNFDEYQNQLSKYKGKSISYADMKRKDQGEDEDMDGDEEIDEDIDEDMDEDEELDEDIEDDLNEDEEEIIEDEDAEIEEGGIEEEDVEDEEMEVEASEPSAKKNKKGIENVKSLLDKEDENYLKTISQYTPNEIKKGKSVTNQKTMFEFFIGLRISIQKIITSINTLPQGLSYSKYTDAANSNNLKLTILDFVKLISTLLNLQKVMILKGNYVQKLNETYSFDISSVFDGLLNTLQNIYTEIEANNYSDKSAFDRLIHDVSILFDKILSISEKVFNIWYRKTLVYSYKSNNKLLKILNNNFSEHIKKNVESNYDDLRQKTKKKNPTDRILGKKTKLISEYDDEIYNDNDFYNYLLKEFISNQSDSNKDDPQNRYDLTLQYLAKKNANNKKNKNVDTKASKNRKLKFEKHEKLINFMVPFANLNINSGRDAIVRSIFGINRKNKENEIEDIDNEIDII